MQMKNQKIIFLSRFNVLFSYLLEPANHFSRILRETDGRVPLKIFFV